LDGTVAQTKEITLHGNDSETVWFNVVPDVIGEHSVGIEGLRASLIVAAESTPAAFAVNNLNIDPTSTIPGEGITISVSVSNTGELSEDYEVVLLIDGTAIETRVITLDGGNTEECRFNIVPEITGEHAVNVNGLTGAFEITEVEEPAALLEISIFDVIPVNNDETGELISARIDYQMKESLEMTPEAELILKVFLDDEPLEEISLFLSGQLQSDGKTGILNYSPLQGWTTGAYAFQAELYDGERFIQSIGEELVVGPSSIAKTFAWKTLGIVIGGAFAVTIITVGIVLYQRRNMLKRYTD
jgi:hypothetical protein